MPIAYSYVRFSSAEQKKGDSLRRQMELSEKFAKENGLTLDSSLHLHDLGVSAYDRSNIERGALGGFLTAIQQGKIEAGSYLLVESLDRLSRDTVLSALEIFISILKNDIIIVTLTDNKIYSQEAVGSNFTDLIISITIMARAHEESAIKSKRISAAWKGKREKIKEKKLTAQCPKWMKLKDDKTDFELIRKNVDTVMKIIDLYKAGMGYSFLAKKLNEELIPTFTDRGTGWHSSYVQKILTSSALYGTYQAHTGNGAALKPVGEPVDNYYPALITKEEFLLLKELRHERTSSTSRAKKGTIIPNLFSSIIKCGYCSGSMILLGGSPKWVIGDDGAKVKKRGKKFFVCDNARRGLKCHAVQWSYNDFEKSFLMFCQTTHLQKIVAEANSKDKNSSRTLSDADLLKSNTAAISEYEKKIENLIQSIESGIQIRSIPARIKSLEDELDILREMNNQLSTKISTEKLRKENKKEKTQTMKNLVKSLDSLPSDKLLEVRSSLAQYFRQNINKITVYPAGWRANYRSAEAMRHAMINESPAMADEINRYVDEHIKNNKLAEPKRKWDGPTARYDINADTDRAFTIAAKNGSYRVIFPDFTDPMKIKIEVQPMVDWQ
jgi:DNA invertase Pin-like site-specific DNA recombinase